MQEWLFGGWSMLQECECGETLFDNARNCPQCQTPNPAFRPPRWRVFWPDLDTLVGADDAIRLGYWAAFGVAILTTAVSLLGLLGASRASLVDAVMFAILGLGIWRKWRSAAVLAFLLFFANAALSLWRGGGVGVLTIFIFAGLLNAVRGTFAHAKLSRVAPV